MSTIATYPIFAALDADWRRFARSDPARRAVERWRQADADLADLHTVNDVLALRRAPDRADRLLRSLVRLAPNDSVAGRAVLQALVPGLIRLCNWWRVDDPESLSSDSVAIAWEKICSYGTRRTDSVAATLLGEVRDQLRYDMRPLLGPEPYRNTRTAEDIALEAVAYEELRSKVGEAVGDSRCLDLIIDSRVNGRRVADIARSRGVKPHTLLMRRHRAEHRLRDVLEAA